MPRYVPRGPVQAHKTDDGEEYLLLTEGNGFMGVLEAGLFELVFEEEADRRVAGAPRRTDELLERHSDRRRPPTVADGIRELVAGRPLPEIPAPPAGVPLVPDDLVPASERMAAAIAARTQPGGPAGELIPVGSPAAALAIEETRLAVDRHMEAARGLGNGDGPPNPNAGKPYGYKLGPGEKAGQGRRVCVRQLESGPCNTVNPVKSKDGKCWGCGKPVKAVKR
jgi:hypothetical protein